MKDKVFNPEKKLWWGISPYLNSEENMESVKNIDLFQTKGLFKFTKKGISIYLTLLKKIPLRFKYKRDLNPKLLCNRLYRKKKRKSHHLKTIKVVLIQPIKYPLYSIRKLNTAIFGARWLKKKIRKWRNKKWKGLKSMKHNLTLLKISKRGSPKE